MSKRLLTALLVALVFLGNVGGALAGDVWVDDQGVALGGYDVVAYFLDGQATLGTATHSVEYNGTTYHFASATHLAIFQAAPQEFLPEYEGHCAFAVAMHSSRAPADPATFKVQDGRLLLFYNGPYEGQIVNTLPLWDESADANLTTADGNWPSVAE